MPRIEGGLIAFGGGVPLYKNSKIIGALGVSGDTACADHETAKRMRNEASLNPPGGMHADDITFPSVDGPSVYSHPLCANTYRDGKSWATKSPAITTWGTALRRRRTRSHLQCCHNSEEMISPEFSATSHTRCN